jgi:hypothetical protein
MNTEKPSPAELKRLVERHQVCWEVWPEETINRDGHRAQIGFELDLLGTHDHPADPPTPGCDECAAVYVDLEKIARAILPEGERESDYEIGAFDSSIRFPPEREFREEITLPIRIIHREGFDRPVDACEVRCLREMESKLEALGAQQGKWKKNGVSS